MEIKVGIKTDGAPVLEEKEGGLTILKNMLIGDGFHWQKSIEVKLPGEITIIGEECEKKIEKIEKKKSQDQTDRHISLINTLPLEKYLECVVCSEMNSQAPVEFLKAHAVISRNWAIGKVLGCHILGKEGWKQEDSIIIGWDDTTNHEGFHVCSDDHCQRYQGVQEIPEKTLSAIKETENQILTDGYGNLIDTRFSKCCGGRTESFSTCWQSLESQCLKSFSDPWCNLSGLSSTLRERLLQTSLKEYDKCIQNYGYRWKSEISKTQIRENLRNKFSKDIGEIKNIGISHRGPSGRIDLIELTGTKGKLTLGKELWIRRLLSSSHLYSSAFETEDLGELIAIRGKGWGHGVGLCQIGAANMAFHGRDYKEILSFYYPGSFLQIKNETKIRETHSK